MILLIVLEPQKLSCDIHSLQHFFCRAFITLLKDSFAFLSLASDQNFGQERFALKQIRMPLMVLHSDWRDVVT